MLTLADGGFLIGRRRVSPQSRSDASFIWLNEMKLFLQWAFRAGTAVSAALFVLACVLWVGSYRARLDAGRSAYDPASHDVRNIDLVTTPGCVNVIWAASPSGVRPNGRYTWEGVPPQYTWRADLPEASWDAEIPKGETGGSFLHFAFARDKIDLTGSEFSATPRRRVGRSPRVMRTNVLCVPAAFPAALFLAMPFTAVVRASRRLRRRRRVANSLCPSCGYDVRASRNRCPECGTELATTF